MCDYAGRVRQQVLQRTVGMVVQLLRQRNFVRNLLVSGWYFFLSKSQAFLDRILGFCDHLFSGIPSVVASTVFGSDSSNVHWTNANWNDV